VAFADWDGDEEAIRLDDEEAVSVVPVVPVVTSEVQTVPLL
jgi:hypothetical protein